MKVVTTAEMRAIDAATSARFGIPSLRLMENAGIAVAQFALQRFPQAEKITVVCGKGNNGGDGFVAARKLNEAGRHVQVLLLSRPEDVNGDAAEMLRRLPHRLLHIVTSAADLQGDPVRLALRAPLIVDAILGSGFNPPVEGLYAAVITAINSAHGSVLAVDVPSGADSDATRPQTGLLARADAVITFTASRQAHVLTSLTSGPVLVAAIGSPAEAIVSELSQSVITPSQVAKLFTPRLADANKGSYGHVFVVGGAFGKAGAPAMAGMAALRSGAGLATVACPTGIVGTVSGFMPELMTQPMRETGEGTLASQQAGFDLTLGAADVLAIGPGLSRQAESAALVRALVHSSNERIVLDADGLNAFEGRLEELQAGGRALVLTPHPGEMARLAGLSVAEVQANRLQVARAFAVRHQVTLVLKGHRTLVAFPDGEVYVNTTGNPGMATGGTGDMLTGMVAGIWAQHVREPEQPREAVLAAVFLHGLAGDIARQHVGEHSLVATDILAALPEAIGKVRTLAALPWQPVCNHLSLC